MWRCVPINSVVIFVLYVVVIIWLYLLCAGLVGWAC